MQRELCGVQPEAEGDSQDVHTNKHKGISQACLLLRVRERETARTRSPAQAAQHSQARQTARGGSRHCNGRSADIVAISSASFQVGNVQVVGQDRILKVPEVVTRRWQELFFVHICTYQCSRTPVNLAKLTC